MGIYASKQTPLVMNFDVEIEVVNNTKQKQSMSLVLTDLSEATEDKICQLFKDKLQELFAAIRSIPSRETQL